ncbi:discoidin domain-containing protein [Arthrobacter sp. I2-34]|uniref:Discoidin domain-containing protein n=1 Tax=Arthrobacter hankyongi TaxID=2904801 RepID=A0ABS9LAE7_9MICC|nr:discoidin domain-containing protein [Arthrobacter hankyongi]MCG2623652.1 discoidin domain-containing protein [Arthrobacter hankyongi]
MPQPVDVGTLLGGRYKVTAHILASAEQDLVLDGVDQVLNRPVSILVASPDNASQVAMSAREIATGEREGNVQVLDLGNAEGHTYLVTNQAEAADLLDLVIQQDAPYVEPFFTETLGSEIFGQARSTEPQYNEDDEEWEAEAYEHASRPTLRERLGHIDLPRFGRGQRADAAGPQTGPHEAVPAADTGNYSAVPAPPPAAPPAARPVIPAPPATRPKVSLWTESQPETGGIQIVARPAPSDTGEYVRRAATFPAAARAAQEESDGYEYDDGYERDEENNPRSPRLLVGGVLALLVIVAIVVAVSQLNVFRGAPAADGGSAPAASQSAAATPDGSKTDAAEAVVKPEIAGLTRQVPDMPELDQENDGSLPKAIDGNPATYWASYQYASDTFGGYASNLALVVELKESSDINSIRMTQLSGRGGQFSVMLNEEPSLDGAKQVARGSFTTQNTTIPVPEEDGAAPKAKYVIINFTQLPQLSNPGSAPPYGVRMAEIQVS